LTVRRLTPYLLLAVLVLGTGLGIGLGLSEAPGSPAPRGASETVVWAPGQGVEDFSIDPISRNAGVFGTPYRLPSENT
jgi:hypothetical protein